MASAASSAAAGMSGILAPFNATRYSFSEALALESCVTQKLSAICPRAEGRQQQGGGDRNVCVPIEPLRRVFAWKTAKTRQNPHASWLADSEVVYKLEQLACEPAFPRFIYVDLGAEHYRSSVGGWFRARYPRHGAFDVVAFEADPYKNGVRGGRSWVNQGKGVEMLPYAVWTQNTTFEFLSEGFGAHLTGDQNLSSMGLSSLKGYGSPRDTKRVVHVRALDFGDFLRRRVAEADYVVVKMDIEGAEYDVVPHLIATGAVHLIDEMYVEVHVPEADGGDMKYMPLAAHRTREQAKDLVGSLRRAGVYAHQWS